MIGRFTVVHCGICKETVSVLHNLFLRRHEGILYCESCAKTVALNLLLSTAFHDYLDRMKEFDVIANEDQLQAIMSEN